MIYIPVYVNTKLPGQEIFSTLEEINCNNTETQFNLTKHCKWNQTFTADNPLEFYVNNDTTESSTVLQNTTENQDYENSSTQSSNLQAIMNKTPNQDGNNGMRKCSTRCDVDLELYTDALLEEAIQTDDEYFY